MQPVTGYTREVMAQAGIGYAIPGLRHSVAALRNVGWWSQVTGDRWPAVPGHHRAPKLGHERNNEAPKRA